MIIHLHIAAVAFGQPALVHALTKQLGKGIKRLLAPQGIKLHREMITAKAIPPVQQRLFHLFHIHAADTEAKCHRLILVLIAAFGFAAASACQARVAGAIHKTIRPIATQTAARRDDHLVDLLFRLDDGNQLRAIENRHAVLSAHRLQLHLLHLRIAEIGVAALFFGFKRLLQFLRQRRIAHKARNVVCHPRNGQGQRRRAAQRIFPLQNQRLFSFPARRAGRHHARRAAAKHQHVIALRHRYIRNHALLHRSFLRPLFSFFQNAGFKLFSIIPQRAFLLHPSVPAITSKMQYFYLTICTIQLIIETKGRECPQQTKRRSNP